MVPPPTPAQKWQAAAFVTALCDLTDAACTWQVFDDKPSKDWRKARKLHGTLRQVGPDLVRANRDGCGIFLAVAKTDLQGRKVENVRKIRALFVDFDGVAPPAPHLPPSMIVQSVNGQHWYWVCGDCPLDQFSAAQKRLALHYGSDPVVHDLPRVMRVPGFWHLKGSPRMVSLVRASSAVYSLAAILDGLPPLPEPVRPVQRQFSPLPGHALPPWRQVDALRLFVDAGLYGRDMGGGKHAVICPWGDSHSHQDATGQSGDTVLWEPSASRTGVAVFRCAHSHCQDKRLSHVCQLFAVA